MILKKLSEFIIVDDIRQDAEASELYFLSHLLGLESLTLPDNWPARIYTSKFIFDVLSKKTPHVKMNFFRILRSNVPVKFRSKDKTIMVTMFQTGEITNNVMFYFEDGTITHLYTGIFTEVCRLNLNNDFKRALKKGIDYIYVDATRCRSKSFLFTDDTVEEISNIYTTIALIIPDFGYEEILVSLLEKLPHKVYPTSNQRKILTRLGYRQLIGDPTESPIRIYHPGITVDFIELNNLVTIYLTEGNPSSNASGIEVCQWSPLPSAMNIQELLEMTRPKSIVSIKRVPLEENVFLPASFKLFLSSDRDVEVSNGISGSAMDSSVESLVDVESNESDDAFADDMNDSRQTCSNQKPRKSKQKAIENIHRSFANNSESPTREDENEAAVSKNRVRVIPRPQQIEYDDSD